MSERNITLRSLLAGAAVAALSMATAAAGGNDPLGVAPAPAKPTAAAKPGAEGGPGLAIRSSKILTAEWQGRSVVNNGVVLVKDGRIEAVGPAAETEIPEGYSVYDAGDDWVMPGLVELHCHVAGAFGLNDTVYLTNLLYGI